MSTVMNGYLRLQSGYWVRLSDNTGPYSTNDGSTFTLAGGANTAVTMADGADATQGATSDPAVAAGAVGTEAAKLRAISRDIGALLTNSSAQQTTLPSEASPFTYTMQSPQKTFRCGFEAAVASGPDTNFFTALQTGAGMAVSQAAGSLVVTTGTTPYSTTLLRSQMTFKSNMTMRYSNNLSQRIANQEFYVELVDVIGDLLAYTINSATSITVTIPSNPFSPSNVGQSVYIDLLTVASCPPGRYAIASVSGTAVTFTVAGFPSSGSGTCSLFGWNHHHLLYDGATATTMKYDCARNGYASGDTTANINSTASPGHIATLSIRDASAALLDQLSASSTVLENTLRASRVRNVPEDLTVLAIQIRIVNLASAPGSTTTWTIGFIEVENFVMQQVSLNGVSPLGFNAALPVMVVGTTEKGAKTYSCSVNVAAAAAATDIAIINGSASATVYVTKVVISGIQTTAGLNDILLVKRSTANSGGTSAGGTVIGHDANDPAAGAAVLAYTANPTPGTAVGNIRRNYQPIGGATSVVNPVVEYNFGDKGKAIVLRGVAQGLAVNLNGATLTGGTFDVSFEWTELP